MSFTPAEQTACGRLVDLALEEDLGTTGDLTTSTVIPPEVQGRALFRSRVPGVLAGLPAAALVFARVDPAVRFTPLQADGTSLVPGQAFARVEGPMRGILTGERTALNFLQRLSGIATLTARHVALIAGLPCRILDTRKTTPGWRLLEKYAVRCGGGHNHRLGLHDGILIKDNHLEAAGAGKPIAAVVASVRQRHGTAYPIEVEVDTLDECQAALTAGANVILLDNMPPDQLREAVRLRNALAPTVRLEASGGVTAATLRSIAETGVDFVSIGALTHSATALDLGLDYER